MSRRCIIHVGTAKTGSSSIQQTLFHELNDARFEYADLGVVNHNRLLLTIYGSPEGRFWRNSQRGAISRISSIKNRMRHRLMKSFAAATADTVVYSGEAICQLAEDRLAELKREFASQFEAIEVVGYARPPRAFMNSSYQQRIKSEPTPLNARRLLPGYRRKFEKLDRIFDYHNVKLWRFNASDFPDGDVVKHFFVSLGIPLPQRVRRVNESLPREAVQILYAFHKFGQRASPGAGRAAAKRQAIALLRGLSNTRFRLSPALLDPVIDRMRDDIAWAEARIGASLAEDRGDEAGAIGSEADMLDIAPEVIARLEEIVSARCDLPGRIDEPAPMPRAWSSG